MIYSFKNGFIWTVISFMLYIHMPWFELGIHVFTIHYSEKFKYICVCVKESVRWTAGLCQIQCLSWADYLSLTFYAQLHNGPTISQILFEYLCVFFILVETRYIFRLPFFLFLDIYEAEQTSFTQINCITKDTHWKLKWSIFELTD